MKVNEFLNEVLAAAKAAGIDPAEVYYHGGDSFNVSALDGVDRSRIVAAPAFATARASSGMRVTRVNVSRAAPPS